MNEQLATEETTESLPPGITPQSRELRGLQTGGGLGATEAALQIESSVQKWWERLEWALQRFPELPRNLRLQPEQATDASEQLTAAGFTMTRKQWLAIDQAKTGLTESLNKNIDIQEIPAARATLRQQFNQLLLPLDTIQGFRMVREDIYAILFPDVFDHPITARQNTGSGLIAKLRSWWRSRIV